MESLFWADLAREQINASSRVVRTLVPYPENGYARLVAATLESALSLQGRFTTSLDNVPQLNGALAIEIVGNSGKRGTALLLGGSGLLTLNSHIRVFKPLIPVCQVCAGPNVYVLSRTVELASASAVVAAARTERRQFSFTSPGPGSFQYALGRAFAADLGLSFRHVQARSSSEMLKNIVTGSATLLCDFIGDLLPLIHQGYAFPVAVTGQERSPALPDTPTVLEVGLSRCEFEYWMGYFTSASVNETLVDGLSASISTALQSELVRNRLSLMDSIAVGGTRESLSTKVERDVEKIREFGTGDDYRGGFGFVRRLCRSGTVVRSLTNRSG